MKEFEARWIGWAGVNVSDEIGQRVLTEALAEKVNTVKLFLLAINFKQSALDHF